MSLTFDAIINVFIGLVTGGFLGFVLGKGQLAKSKRKLEKMEMEVLSANRETLDSQRALAELESRLKNQTIPVIPMKINGSKENSKEKATSN